MKVDAMLDCRPNHAADSAEALENAGFNGLWSAEHQYDPFLPLTVASRVTGSAELGTSIAVAFARNPMDLAQLAWDLQAYSRGRFIVGLGTQIKPHIERRFSMPWGRPAARMRETVLAIRAIWETWQTGAPLQFEGEFYTHTLMSPELSPDPSDNEAWGPPPIFIAGVGPLVTRTAAEVADGFIFHAFTTARYIETVTLPALREGRSRSAGGRFQVSGPVLFVTGETEEQMREASRRVKHTIAFYGSTPAYRAVLEAHGWGDLQTDLHKLAKAGRWDEMGSLISDEILTEFAIVAEPSGAAARVVDRFDGLIDRFSLDTPYEIDGRVIASIAREVIALTAGRDQSPGAVAATGAGMGRPHDG
jgi:probable F420-dependent oxidoreductase